MIRILFGILDSVCGWFWPARCNHRCDREASQSFCPTALFISFVHLIHKRQKIQLNKKNLWQYWSQLFFHKLLFKSFIWLKLSNNMERDEFVGLRWGLDWEVFLRTFPVYSVYYTENDESGFYFLFSPSIHDN